MTVERACEVCGAVFKRRIQKGRPAPRFCSLACRDLGHRSLAEKTCPACGRGFRPRRHDTVYCSRECVPAAPPGSVVDVECEECGRAFAVPPHMQAVRRFCSMKCKVEASKCWPKDRTCASCGATFLATRQSHVACSRRCGQQVSRSAAQRPWTVGSRRLLARTCDLCDKLLPSESFPTSGDGYRQRRCIACIRESRTPLQLQRKNWVGTAADIRAQDSTSPARNWGKQWTGVELEIALREDLTAREAGLMLGRTYYAVQAARRKARVDPKWQSVVGMAG